MLHCPQNRSEPGLERPRHAIRSQLGQCAHLSRQLTDWQLACITQKHNWQLGRGIERGERGGGAAHTHFPPGCQRSSLWLTVSFNWLWSIYCCQFDKSMQANVAQVKPNRIGFSLNWNADEPRLQASGTSEATRQRCGACSCYLFQLAPDSGHEPEIIKEKTLNLRQLKRKLKVGYRNIKCGIDINY